MKKRLLALLFAGIMCLMCGCSDDDSGSSGNAPEFGGVDVSMYENEDGNVVYHYNLDGETPGGESSVDTLVHRAEEKKVEAADGGISLQKAEEILDSCSSYRVYLPGKIKNFKKRFNDIIQFNDKDYYSISFYVEKNSVRMYVGSDVIVACDGSEVYRQDAAGSYRPLEPGTAGNDKETAAMYPDAKITPEDALFTLYKYDRGKIGLDENMLDYTFEVREELSVMNNIQCYQITPKLTYASSVKLCPLIYVAADGSERVLILSSDKTGYVMAE